MMRADACHAAWRELPVAGLDAIIGPGTCLVLAPHPDDESLGCGGLIAACCADGRPPTVAILTDGGASHPGSRAVPPEQLRLIRAREAHQAVAHLGLASERLVFCGYADAQAPRSGPDFDDAVRVLCGLCSHDPNCKAILAPWQHDPHHDHEAASLIAAAVAAECGIRHVAYPVWGWLLPPEQMVPADRSGGWRLDIEPFLAAKRRAIQAHKSQYGSLITDDPSGFQLPPALLSVFETRFETYLPA
jgi:LmbE family N-acetylglucosaminyl deacetylase